ncbi:MAG: FHA domain-containing protein [Pseudomonadota bacterium]
MNFGAALSIGRHPFNDLVIEDDLVSSRHAVIEWQRGRCLVRDLGSSNGTTVNGRRIMDWRSLREGDVLRLAGCSSWRVACLRPPLADDPGDGLSRTRGPGGPPVDLLLELEPQGPGEGLVRLVRLSQRDREPLGQLHAGQGFVLLQVLAEAEGGWVADRDLRSALWGRLAPRMSRSSLHTLIRTLRQQLAALGVQGEIFQKERGRTRLALPPGRVHWPGSPDPANLRID